MRFILTAIVFLSAHLALADEVKTDAGTWSFGYNLGLSYSDDQGMGESIGVSGRYFLIDRLALGLELENIQTDDDYSQFTYGPSLTYYYFKTGPAAFYITQALQIGKEVGQRGWFYNESRDRFGTATYAGVDFRVGEHMSIGPRLGYGWDFNDPDKGKASAQAVFTFSF